MKLTSRLLLLSVLACSAFSPLSRATVLYSESFPNAASPDKAVSSVGWNLVTATNASSTITTSTTAHGVVSFASGSDGTGGFLYSQPGINGGMRAFTETGLATATYPGLTLGNIGTITFDAAANNSAITVQLLIQTNSTTWYSSSQIFTLNNLGTFAAAATAGVLTYSLDFTTATWKETTFTVGELLSISGTTSTLSGDITGIGFLVKNNHASSGSVVRLDALTVNSVSAVPEPSTCALMFGGAALAGALIIRRRRA